MDRDAPSHADDGRESVNPAPSEHLERLASLFEARPAAILTGAGISTDS